MMPTIHVSAMPMLAICNGALTLEGPDIRFDDGGGEQGKLVHAAAAAIVEGREPPPDAPYIGTLRAIWAELSPSMPGARAEESWGYGGEDNPAVVGKTDAVALCDDETVIVDWFAGQQAPDKEQQGRGYGWLVTMATSRTQPVRFIEVNVPDASMRQWVWSRPDLESWAADFFYNLRRPPSFSVGSQCRWCPKYAVCPAHTALMRKAADVLQIQGKVDALPREQKADLWAPLALLKAMVEAAQESIKADIIAHGPISLGMGYELISRIELRSEIEPLAAWPIISKQFTDAELATAMKIKKAVLESLASAHAAQGTKGNAKKQLMAALEAAGAVTHSTITKVVRARKGNSND